MKHFHIWGCPAELRPYRPNEKKLDSRIISYYFIGYSERSRGYKFYDPMTKFFFETGNARIFEDVEFKRRDKVRDLVFEKEFVSLPTVVINNDQVSISDIAQITNLEQDNVDELPIQNQDTSPEKQTQQP